MKVVISSIIFCLLLLTPQLGVSAADITVLDAKVADLEVQREEVFIFMGDFYREYVPSTYKYINIEFKGIGDSDTLHESLQILVYLDFIKNTETNIHSRDKLKASHFYALCEKIFGADFRNHESESRLNDRYTTALDILKVKQGLKKIQSNIEKESLAEITSSQSSSRSISQKKAILGDVYNTLLSGHYDKDTLDEEKMLYSAIEGLAKGTGDAYTTYFPPVENKSFQESLNGEYEGIGSYVEMPEPGLVQIISPIVGSPSEKAGIKGGDIIIQIGDVKVREDMSLNEAISYIKGPAGTDVDLTIKRGNKILIIKVKRAKIVIKDIEYDSPRTDTFYIQIKTFGEHVDTEFKIALEELESRKGVKKVIIDVRNNPGGYLNKVNNMLSYFVEMGEPTAIVRYQQGEVKHRSKGYDLIDFSKYKIVFLQNSGTASASEILVGTVKDYYPDSVIIGETSFGKGSVQDIKSYIDGSSLKYTIAKWFTGKTAIGIDKVGISPDIELELDQEQFLKGTDNQYQRALQVR